MSLAPTLNVTWYTQCETDADLDVLATSMSQAFVQMGPLRRLQASDNEEDEAEEETDANFIESMLGPCAGGNLYTCKHTYPPSVWYTYCSGCPCFFGGPGCSRRLAAFSADKLSLIQVTLQSKGRASRPGVSDTVVYVEND
jgi:hypothetical protein